MLVLAALVFVALAWHRSLDPILPPVPGAFDAAVVRRGAQLAAIGNCAGCHTAPHGRPFAGGTAVETPFGTLYGANITPDAYTGIGRWSEPAFRRALREGVSRDGHLLYPAFPYDHFTHLADADIAALYAFVMTRDAVAFDPPPNRLRFPLGFRPLIAGWNLLFLDPGPRPPQPAQSAEWNHGAYLTAALAHCSACHAPRNALGAEKRDTPFAGGVAEGWMATALDAHSPSPVPWSADALASYLRTGLAPDHAIAAGPMQDVVHALSQVPETDLRAIAVYMQSQSGPPTPGRPARESAARARAAQPALAALVPATRTAAPDAAQMTLGARVYAESCASCHDAGRQLSSSGGLRLPLAVALYLPDPRNLIRIVRLGIQPPAGQPGRWMPAFDGTLTDEQITALTAWLRRQATDEAPWPDLARTVQDTRTPSP